MKIFFITLLVLFCSSPLLAERNLALIKDPDGFTFIRSGPGKDHPIVDTLFQDDFFYCDLDTNAEWIKSMAWKGRRTEGYVHKSRIQLVDKLSNKKQNELLTKILKRHKELSESFRKAYENKDSLAYKQTRFDLEYHSDTKYSPVLDILPDYFCPSGDTAVLHLFIVAMCANVGSANELPSFAIGDCFVCKPDLVLKQLDPIRNRKIKTLLFDHIEWGLLNHYYVEGKDQSQNPEFKRLKTKLDNERKKLGL